MTIASSRVIVYWRPYCPYCVRLRRGLRREGIDFAEVNIWKEPEAAKLVRSHAGGNETVPTVAVGEMLMINPSAPQVLDVIREHHPEFVTHRATSGGGRWNFPLRKHRT